jgi:cold shock CspA family protein
MREQGVVVKYLHDRGFGFIKVDGSGAADDMFIHASELRPGVPQSAIKEGVRVAFDVSHKYGKPRAVDVELA